MTGFRRAAALAAAALLALLLPVAVAPSPAHACSCARSPIGAQARSADVPFVGVVRSSDVVDDGQQVEYVVDVERSWSGDVGTPVVVTSGAQGGACGVEGLEPGDRWLMLAYGSDGELSIGLCDGSAPADRRLLEKVETALGPGSTDVPAARDDDDVTYGGLGPRDEGWVARVVGGACCLGVGALVVALVVAVLRRRRSGR